MLGISFYEINYSYDPFLLNQVVSIECRNQINLFQFSNRLRLRSNSPSCFIE